MSIIIRVSNWEKYQLYKKKNKNYNNEQPWFMFYGRKLLSNMRYMSMTPEQRDFLVNGCWAVGSQNNGFLPDANQLAFWIRREPGDVIKLIDFLLEDGWLEVWEHDAYLELQDEIEDQIHQNRLERLKENS